MAETERLLVSFSSKSLTNSQRAALAVTLLSWAFNSGRAEVIQIEPRIYVEDRRSEAISGKLNALLDSSMPPGEEYGTWGAARNRRQIVVQPNAIPPILSVAPYLQAAVVLGGRPPFIVAISDHSATHDAVIEGVDEQQLLLRLLTDSLGWTPEFEVAQIEP